MGIVFDQLTVVRDWRVQHATACCFEELRKLNNPKVNAILKKWNIQIAKKVIVDYPPQTEQILEGELTALKQLEKKKQ